MLNLSRNILTEVSSETLNQLKRLHMLDLSFNSIVLLEPGNNKIANKLVFKAVFMILFWWAYIGTVDRCNAV